jgi:hypothetical protein
VTFKFLCFATSSSIVDLSKMSSRVSFANIKLNCVLSSGFFRTSLITWEKYFEEKMNKKKILREENIKKKAERN